MVQSAKPKQCPDDKRHLLIEGHRRIWACNPAHLARENAVQPELKVSPELHELRLSNGIRQESDNPAKWQRVDLACKTDLLCRSLRQSRRKGSRFPHSKNTR